MLTTKEELFASEATFHSLIGPSPFYTQAAKTHKVKSGFKCLQTRPDFLGCYGKQELSHVSVRNC